jgi:CRP-like cAMP-binding protein
MRSKRLGAFDLSGMRKSGAGMELDDNTAVLDRADFFSICDTEQKRLLAFASERKAFSAGDIIFAKGDASDGAYVLIRGQVAAGDSSTSGSKLQRISEAGAVLGELGLVLSRPRRASMRAATDVELLFVPRSAFAKLMKQYPIMAERAAMRIETELQDYLAAMAPFANR